MSFSGQARGQERNTLTSGGRPRSRRGNRGVHSAQPDGSVAGRSGLSAEALGGRAVPRRRTELQGSAWTNLRPVQATKPSSSVGGALAAPGTEVEARRRSAEPSTGLHGRRTKTSHGAEARAGPRATAGVGARTELASRGDLRSTQQQRRQREPSGAEQARNERPGLGCVLSWRAEISTRVEITTEDVSTRASARSSTWTPMLRADAAGVTGPLTSCEREKSAGASGAELGLERCWSRRRCETTDVGERETSAGGLRRGTGTATQSDWRWLSLCACCWRIGFRWDPSRKVRNPPEETPEVAGSPKNSGASSVQDYGWAEVAPCELP
ncbi:unnamed protein product [Pleuronectes platessa]|uniref:Uncharacterized protein n=1 Tax=Pleuronectes platessa TaxID=8262 RepID=A0A9N7V6J4_PLEPL|nr:unnamed protein product [Pleuronectes platessa]